MACQASITDVPASANGRSCHLSVDARGITFRYKRSHEETTIPRENVKTSVTRGDMLAINLVEPMQVKPGTAKATRNVLIHRPRFLDDSVWSNTVDSLALCLGSLNYNMVGAITTACGSTEVQMNRCSDPVVVWKPKACVVASDVRAVILQRTCGGMSTYDVHVLPRTDPVLSITMLDHESLPVWDFAFGPSNVVDTGPSQVSLQDAEAAQHEDDVRYFLCGSDSGEEGEVTNSGSDSEYCPDPSEPDSDSMSSDAMLSSAYSDSDSNSGSSSMCDDGNDDYEG